MAVYAYLNVAASAVGTGANTILTVGAGPQCAVITGLTVTNILADPVAVTISIVSPTGPTTYIRVNAVQLNPGAIMNPMSDERWILPTSYTLTLTAGVAAALDIVIDYITVT